MRRDGRDNTKKIRGFISKVVPSKKGIGKREMDQTYLYILLSDKLLGNF